MIPDSDKQNNDVIDLISTAAHHMEMVEEDGKWKKGLVLDPESLYWSTRSVNSTTLARFVYELKQLEALAYETANHMAPQRAQVLKEQILRLYDSYKKSIDSKASESKRDDHNSQLTLIDKLSRNKQERIVSLKEDAKKSLFSGMFGSDDNKDES